MKGEIRDRLEMFAAVVAAGALALAAAGAGPQLRLGPHVYRGSDNAGVVAWQCGPGLELRGHPGLFVESC